LRPILRGAGELQRVPFWGKKSFTGLNHVVSFHKGLRNVDFSPPKFRGDLPHILGDSRRGCTPSVTTLPQVFGGG